MPLHIERWLTSQGIRSLDPLAELAFLKLLMWAWSTESCTIPDDDSKLKALAGIGSAWKRHGPAVREFWRPHPTLPGRLYNEFQVEKRIEQEEIWLQRKEAGERSGKARNARGAAEDTLDPTLVQREPQRSFNESHNARSTSVPTLVPTVVERATQRSGNHPEPDDDDVTDTHARDASNPKVVLRDPCVVPPAAKKLKGSPFDFGHAKALETVEKLGTNEADVDAWVEWSKTHGHVAVRAKVQKYKHPADIPKDPGPQRSTNLDRRSSFAQEGKFNDPKFNQSSQ